MNMSAAAQQNSAKSPSPPDWHLVVQPRLGKPPLRFRGRCLSRACLRLAETDEVMISLWQKQKNGFVVCHSVANGQGAVEAVAVASLQAAMDHLENTCAEMHGPQPMDLPGDLSVAGMVAEIARRGSFHQRFRILAGHVLAQWDGWTTSAAGN